MSDNYLSFDGVTKSFGPVDVVSKTKLSISRGSLDGLLGVSGSPN